VLGTSFAVGKLGSIAMHAIHVIEALFCGPILGLYMSGIFSPWTNKIGGLCGILLSMGFNLWIIIGQIVYGKNSAKNDLVFSIEECAYPYNVTQVENVTMSMVPEVVEERPVLADTLYQISLPFLGIIGLITCIVFSQIISFATGAQKAEDADPKLFMPLVSNKCFSEKTRQFFMLGVSREEEVKSSTNSSDITLEDLRPLKS